MKNSIIAFITDNRVAINSKLEVAGFGPDNFSIPLYNDSSICTTLSSIGIKPIVAFYIEALKNKFERREKLNAGYYDFRLFSNYINNSNMVL